MKTLRYVFLCMALASTGSMAQAQSPGDLTNGTITPPGQNTRTLGARALDLPSVADLPNVTCDGVTDDSAALQAGLAQYIDTGAKVLVPNGCRLLMGGGGQIRLQGFTLEGTVGRDNGRSMAGGYGKMAGTILLTDTAKSPFIAGAQWGLSHLQFYWPNQTNAKYNASNQQPIVYPALLTNMDATTEMYDWSFDNNQVENGYDIIDITKAVNAGHFHIDDNQVFALHYAFDFQQVGGESWILHNQFSLVANIYDIGDISKPGLAQYAMQHGEFVHIAGTGTASASPKNSVDGMVIADNYCLLARQFVHVDGGQLNISEMNNNGVDSTPQGFEVDNYGVATAVQINGGIWLNNDFLKLTTTLPAIGIFANPNGAAHDTSVSAKGGSTDLIVTGLNIAFSEASAIAINDTNSGNLKVTGSRLGGSGTGGSSGSASIIFSSNGFLELSGNSFSGSGGNYGVMDNASTVSQITGNFFSGFNTSIFFASPGTKTVVGNTGINSTTDASVSGVAGPYAYQAVQGGNSWDKGGQVTRMYAPSGQPDQINCDGAASGIGCQIIGKGASQHRFFVNSNQQVLQVGTDGGGTNSAIIAGGSGATLSSTAGNTNISSAANVAINNLLPCSSAPSGYLCSQGSGAAAIVKP